MEPLFPEEIQEQVEALVKVITERSRLQNLVERSVNPDPELLAELDRVVASIAVSKEIIRMREEEVEASRQEQLAGTFSEANRLKAIELVRARKAEIDAARDKTMFGKSRPPDLMKLPAKEFVELFNLQKERLHSDIQEIELRYRQLFDELRASASRTEAKPGDASTPPFQE